MTKVLILGTTGMLGSMVFDYLSRHSDFDVAGTLRDEHIFCSNKNRDKLFFYDIDKDAKLDRVFQQFKPDYIINCIGIIKPFCKDDDMKGVARAVRINAWFPHYLAQEAEKINTKVIQIATDCVYSGKRGNYKESDLHDALDVYGKTKSLGEVVRPNFLNIRCSIIGPELKNKLSLLEWFLNQPAGEKLKGFSHHRWNGVTTLQFAKLCQDIIDKGDECFNQLVKTSPVHHFVPNKTVNKYELLNIFNQVFGRNFEIEQVDNIGEIVDRTLATKFNFLENNIGLMHIQSALEELKDYMDRSGVL